MDLADASPARGWRGVERRRLEERGRPDLVLCLALVHHLAIGNNVPLESLAAFLAQIGRHVAIEFVPKEDEKVQRLLMNREDVFPAYSVEGFERSLSGHFDVLRKLQEPRGMAHAEVRMLVRCAQLFSRVLAHRLE